MNTFDLTKITPDNNWLPFRVSLSKADPMRALATPEGIVDRLRLVAFAEVQAFEAFRWGAQKFSSSAPASLVSDWLRFADMEQDHASRLINRLVKLGGDLGARSVSDRLWHLCRLAQDWQMFLFLLGSAEERGMESGSILAKQMLEFDCESARIFGQIAEEEQEHVRSSRLAIGHLPLEKMQERARGLNATLPTR